MTKFVHNDAIEWPNGLGYTPCTTAYADLHGRLQRLKPDSVNLDDLSNDDYEAYCSMSNQLDEMLLAGHLGQSVRY